MNQLREANTSLVQVNYSDILQKIIAVLNNPQTNNPFSVKQVPQNQPNDKSSVKDCKRLVIDIDTIATIIAASGAENPLGASANSARRASINWTPGFEERFPHQINQITKALQTLLELAIRENNYSLSIKAFVSDFITDLQNFQADSPKLNFNYPFDKVSNDLQKQRLTLRPNNTSSPEILRFHKLEIAVKNTYNFDNELREGLENYIKTQFTDASEDDREYLSEFVDDLSKKPSLDLDKLKQVVNTETLGKLKKEAQICYLEYLRDHLKTHTKGESNTDGFIYLEVLIKRLKLINQYINDDTKGDGHYSVNYAGVNVNYRDLFSEATAFDLLPIIPIIAGYLGETTDRNKGEKKFIFGLKLKLNGNAYAYGGEASFDYHLNQLDTGSKEHQALLKDPSQKQAFAKKVLKIAFLYYFVFACDNPEEEGYQAEHDLDFDPVSKFEEKVLPILKEADDAKKQRIFRGLIKGFRKYKVSDKIKKLKETLKNCVGFKTPFSSQDYPRHISIKESLLESDLEAILNNLTFFKSDLRENQKKVLKYLSIGEANAKNNSICTLSANLTISDIHFSSTDDYQSFNMAYDNITGVKALPVLFGSKEELLKKIDSQSYKELQLIAFPYNLENHQLEAKPAFLYQFVFSLLGYTCLKILLEKQQRLFIPILRLHVKNLQDNTLIDHFMRSFSKVLAHLLNEEHRSNAQGIDLRNLNKHKVANAMSSLYSILPKKFSFKNDSDSLQSLDKLAIIVVSSRESDAVWSSSYKKSNLMGEIVGVRRQKDGTIKLQLLTTFSENYEHEEMFKNPSIIGDKINYIYKMGFKHFVYIAKAPYTSTLHMTQKGDEDDDGLFFMSKDVMSTLKQAYKDIKIYPIFFDKYYAVKISTASKASSLYIQETLELTTLVEDPSKKCVVFFNLFNGMSVGNKNERNYNGVISYATLLGDFYQNILEDEDIRKGLISDTSLKHDILQSLTLFHFSRYERNQQKINLKLDPYENLIGDDSVGKLSLIDHMSGWGQFNLLAFLTEVRRVLNAPKIIGGISDAPTDH